MDYSSNSSSCFILLRTRYEPRVSVSEDGVLGTLVLTSKSRRNMSKSIGIKKWLFYTLLIFSCLGLYFCKLALFPTGHPMPHWIGEDEIDWSTVPIWDVTTPPPLSLSNAVQIARADIEKSEGVIGWRPISITLANTDRRGTWLYEISFTNCHSQEWADLYRSRRITMNGKVMRLVWPAL